MVVSANIFAPKRICFYTGERFIVDNYKDTMKDLIVEAPLPSEHFDSDWVKNTLSREFVQYMELLVKSDICKNGMLVAEMLTDFFRQNSSIGGKVNIAGTMYFNSASLIQIMLVSYMQCWMMFESDGDSYSIVSVKKESLEYRIRFLQSQILVGYIVFMGNYPSYVAFCVAICYGHFFFCHFDILMFKSDCI